MKRIFSLMAVCLLALGLAACGSSPASSGEPKDYVTILTDARPAEDNESLVIFHLKDGVYTATGGYAGDLTDEDMFGAAPKKAWTVHVGNGPTRARFALRDSAEVRGLLRRLAEAR